MELTARSSEKDRLLVLPTPSLSLLPAEYKAIVPYVASRLRLGLYVLLCVGSGGVLCVLASWWPRVFTALARVRCVAMGDADFVILTSANGDVEEAVVHRDVHVWFEFKKQRYLYSPTKGKFERVASVLREACGTTIQRLDTGLTAALVADRVRLFGPNAIEIPTAPLHKVLFHKLVHPFYLFQLVSVGLWLEEEYYTYALAILAMSLSSIVYEVVTQVQNARQMEALVRCDTMVPVVRDGVPTTVAASDLVVGDIVVVAEGMAAADMVLLAGECSADESSLTGEAIPVAKQRLSDHRLAIDAKAVPKTAVVFAGSVVLRTSGSTKAVVVRTGFSTSKGELFRSILFPDEIPFRIVSDSYRYLLALGAIATVTTLLRIYDAIAAGSSLFDLLISVFDLISTAIPAALPMILTVGIGFSLTRLQDADIFCIDAQRINVSGHLDCFCFDKTGTLTTESLDFIGVDLCDGRGTAIASLPEAIVLGLASCHGLTPSASGVTGYPLEQSMFAATGCSLRSTAGGLHVVRDDEPVLRIRDRFAFDAAVQRSSAIVEAPALGAYVKGSPEALREICVPASLPQDLDAVVHAYVCQGHYVLALAHKPLAMSPRQRGDVESDVHFLGLLLFVNPIKAHSAWVVETLQAAAIDVHIITGDNALTTIHVARSVGLRLRPHVALVDYAHDQLQYKMHYGAEDEASLTIDSFEALAAPAQQLGVWHQLRDAIVLDALLEQYDVALTGSAIEWLAEEAAFATLLPRLVSETKIFARVKPHTKTWIVQQLMAMGKYVGMTGDGTNDCGALKAAHVGLALSNAEASIVAPFTSRRKDIRDVVALVREGRCALATSLLAFKFMVMYPVIETTLITVINHVQATFSNNQYLFDDLVVVLGLSVLMLRTGPAPTLTRARPPESLFAPAVLWSVAAQTILFGVFAALPLWLAHRQDWFCALPDVVAGIKNCFRFQPNESGDMTTHSHEVSIVWTTGHLQYLILAIAFNVPDPFRSSAWTNRWFVLYTAAMGVVLTVILIAPGSALDVQWLDLVTPLPQYFCYEVFGLFLLNITASIACELAIRSLTQIQ
ncbi:P-type ATPase (P-ATPase) Superfamily [Achlya hypogyna]|uniref:Cation-transporting ATPase n=1 Tax=Achlya hypogyna TaxID=1202772 RepID=A0A1V9YQZ7_ACHHY|nr:P-type ATPase (P-ATPase) Superfamily [Achlya hypogyna]